MKSGRGVGVTGRLEEKSLGGETAGSCSLSCLDASRQTVEEFCFFRQSCELQDAFSTAVFLKLRRKRGFGERRSREKSREVFGSKLNAGAGCSFSSVRKRWSSIFLWSAFFIFFDFLCLSSLYEIVDTQKQAPEKHEREMIHTRSKFPGVCTPERRLPSFHFSLPPSSFL